MKLLSLKLFEIFFKKTFRDGPAEADVDDSIKRKRIRVSLKKPRSPMSRTNFTTGIYNQNPLTIYAHL